MSGLTTAAEALRERTCELEFIYRLGNTVESAETLDTLLHAAAVLIPSAWYCPENIACEIIWEEKKHFSEPEVKENEVRKELCADLFCYSEKTGEIWISYNKDSKYCETSIREKKVLLQMVAVQLGHAGERFYAKQTIESQQRQLVRADKLVAMGTLAAGVAHEINNPTCFIMLNTPMLEEMWQPVSCVLEQYCREKHLQQIGKFDAQVLMKAFPTLLAGIHKGGRRIKHIVREMKEFVREDDLSMESAVDMNRVLHSAEALLHNKLKTTTLNYRSDCCETLPVVKGNFQRLEQVVINLIINACEALNSENQCVSVHTYTDKKNNVCLAVTDQGTGIPQDELKHIFDPFFTTKRDIGGTGLGLAISNNIVAEHNGELIYQSVAGAGTSVVLKLPVQGSGGGK